ncbi:MAG: 50S ribosomal protein L22 [Chitinophagales bacterium]|nr:50S ribosomal protein L22 [Chitinophagales bacterium]
MEAIAHLRNNPTSDRKMRLVADLIRGKRVEDALVILRYSKQEASRKLEKLLKSAINNWQQKHDANPENYDLFIKEIFVNQGRTLKRFLPAPQGRACRIRKRSNHVTIRVASSKPPVTEIQTNNNNSAAEATNSAETNQATE